MNRKLVEYLIAICATAVSAFVKDNFFLGPGNQVRAYTASILAGVLSFAILTLVRRFLDWGLKFDPRLMYVGKWIDKVSDSKAHFYSMFEITYDFLGDELRLVGNTYDGLSHQVHADWHSIAVSCSEAHTLYFIHKAVVHGRAGAVSGLSRLSFVGSGNRYYEGTGYLIDNSEPIFRGHLTFERLDSAQIKQLIGRKTIKSIDDRKRFFQAWIAAGTTSQVVPQQTGAP